MTRMPDRKGAPLSRLMITGVAVAALSGWGAYAHSVLSSAELGRQLSGQAAALQDYQTQFLALRKKADDGARTVAALQERLASAQGEIARLAAQHKDAEADLAAAQDQLASFQKIHAPPALDRAPALIGVTPLPTKQDVLSAQEALTRLGFGELEADGVVGPSTRDAIEAFQRLVGLTVTGELHAQTLQSLMRAAKVVEAQNDRAE